MAWPPRRTEAHEVAAAQFVESTQEMMLTREPALVFRDDLVT
jgi:hypothetical protein